MNQSLSDFELYSFNDINLFQKYEICRQQSQCYLLIPPPRLPIFPKLFPTNPSSTSTNLRQRTDSFFIIFGIFITLIFTCLLLFFLSVKFQFYHKLRQRYRRTKDANMSDESPSFSNIVPISYNSLTPSTITTNQSPSLAMINKPNMILQQQHLNSTDRSCYHNHSINMYEEIRIPSDHHYCSHTLSYYQKKYPLTPYYYTYELSPSKIVCQNCLLENLHRQQQQQKCLCHNFFVPIK